MSNQQSAGNTSFAPNQRFPLADNMDNIDKIERMWRAQWPEFSWLTVPGDESSRCYQMFAPDISRVGYGNKGFQKDNKDRWQVYAVMCPQQGMWIPVIQGTLNIEVTVTSAGGWVTENPMVIDSQITVAPKIWFSPDTMQTKLVQLLWNLFKWSGIPFPLSKQDNPITINTYGVDSKDQPTKSPVLNIVNGQDPNFPVPAFAIHSSFDEDGMIAACVVYLSVEIGEMNLTGNSIADEFNTLVMEIFNIASGNLLLNKNVLSWNVWALAPEAVYTPEWKQHADYWRFSIDVNHRSPEGNGRDPRYFNGKPFNALASAICSKLEELKEFILKYFSGAPNFQEAIDEIDSLITGSTNEQPQFL